jgi:hypothetical protein
MFGNLKGWGISVLIAVAVSLLILFVGQPPRISPPTGTLSLAMNSISDAMKDEPASLGIKPTGTDVDAQDLYLKVIDDYAENHFKYEKYADVKKLAADKPEFLQWIVDAADGSKAGIFGRKPELIINYENEQDSLVALKTAGLCADNLGLYLVVKAIGDKTSLDEADQYLKGAFMLGERLYYERLRFEEVTAGTELIAKAAYAMQKEAAFQHDDARAARLESFQAAVASYNTRVVPVWQAISGIDGNPLNNAGDVFDIAANSKETMWRVEAALKLGRMHYMGNVTGADQRGAVRVLKQMAESADVLPVRVAAEKGRDLKIEDFRKFGGGS